MKPSDTITLNAPSEFPLQILHEVAIMTILITRGESLRARPLPPARYARCLPTAPPVFPQRQNKNKQKPLFFSFKKQTRFCFLVPWRIQTPALQLMETLAEMFPGLPRSIGEVRALVKSEARAAAPATPH